MRFSTDQQTLEDLNIFDKNGGNSIYSLFNRTSTRGGALILEEMFRYPLSEIEAINKRSSIIRYYSLNRAVFSFGADLFDMAEQYLQNTDERTKLDSGDNTLGQKLAKFIAEDAGYKIIYNGVTALKEIIIRLNDFAVIDKGEITILLAGLLADPEISVLLQESNKLSYTRMAVYDKLLRFHYRDSIKKILQYIYHLDVYISVAKIALERKFTFALAVSKEQRGVLLEGVYHPRLPVAVSNTLRITPDSNVIFLTGANMAGKSTFMKTIGISLFLAHMGFPVAAEKMEFSVLDGIYTTINLADNLDAGASHFYAEVLRIKRVARELALGKNLFIIFDELFRGTNVKDAYDATIAITGAFATKQNSMFVISTHIMEAADILKERHANISFRYLPTHMNGNLPEYTYTLETGITADRHGMVIIHNEGILEILNNGKIKVPVS